MTRFRLLLLLVLALYVSFRKSTQFFRSFLLSAPQHDINSTLPTLVAQSDFLSHSIISRLILSHLIMASSNRNHNHLLRRTTMLNNHAQTQAHSISPVLRKHTDIAPKPSKDYRRATIAHGHVTTKDTSARAPRIEKSVRYPRNQNRSNDENLVQKFDGDLKCSLLLS